MDQIKSIQLKLEQLLKQYGQLQKENRQLLKELEKSKLETEKLTKTTDELKQQVDVLKISSAAWDENDKKELEKRINYYLGEIDRCIDLLRQ